MATLGTSYRVVYTAQNFTSGLLGIYAKALKPDGSIGGNYPLTELSGAFFAGIYYFDLMTSVSDPKGEWVVVIFSPTENYRAIKKIEYNDLLTTTNFLGLK